MRQPGLVAGGVRRIERQLGQEALARGIAAAICSSCSRSARRTAASSWMRSRCGSYQRRALLELGRPARAAAAQVLKQLGEARPVAARPRRRRHVGKCRAGSGNSAIASSDALRRGRADARQQLHAAGNPRRGRAGSRRSAAAASTSLTCAASRNFRPPNLTNGMLRRVSSTSSGPLWCEARNSTACYFRARAGLALLQHALDDVARLVGLVAHASRAAGARRTAARSRDSW